MPELEVQHASPLQFGHSTIDRAFSAATFRVTHLRKRLTGSGRRSPDIGMKNYAIVPDPRPRVGLSRRWRAAKMRRYSLSALSWQRLLE